MSHPLPITVHHCPVIPPLCHVVKTPSADDGFITCCGFMELRPSPIFFSSNIVAKSRNLALDYDICIKQKSKTYQTYIQTYHTALFPGNLPALWVVAPLFTWPSHAGLQFWSKSVNVHDLHKPHYGLWHGRSTILGRSGSWGPVTSKRSPKIRVPLTPESSILYNGMFHDINQPFFGYPHGYGNHHMKHMG